MKKLLFGILATVLFSPAFAQNARLIDIKGSEIGILVNVKEDNSFKEYFLFQYKDFDFSNLVKSKEVKIVQASKNVLILNCDNNLISFTIDGNHKQEDATTYSGYGLSKRNGNFSLNKQVSNPTSVPDYVLIDNVQHRSISSITCHSGGAGATECSVTPSSVNVGAAGCTVSCGSGFHACCDDTRGECRCIQNAPGKVKSIN